MPSPSQSPARGMSPGAAEGRQLRGVPRPIAQVPGAAGRGRTGPPRRCRRRSPSRHAPRLRPSGTRVSGQAASTTPSLAAGAPAGDVLLPAHTGAESSAPGRGTRATPRQLPRGRDAPTGRPGLSALSPPRAAPMFRRTDRRPVEGLDEGRARAGERSARRGPRRAPETAPGCDPRRSLPGAAGGRRQALEEAPRRSARPRGSTPLPPAPMTAAGAPVAPSPLHGRRRVPASSAGVATTRRAAGPAPAGSPGPTPRTPDAPRTPPAALLRPPAGTAPRPPALTSRA